MHVSYMGSELNRAGGVAIGQTAGDTVVVGTTYTPDEIIPLLENYLRTPERSVEHIWVPSFADQSFE
jgi:hypothetical protein